ncbi:hypothetical protein EZV62_027017 [Acer yangbiense]|uniref:Uncharacterized protein n=1 Tax=Acer yangbiense TaxID=1000413 RepID=A0A5C7GSX9_9ROSI|nr:hypothetical protein EZV62_027017 [Acer yangbiense]
MLFKSLLVLSVLSLGCIGTESFVAAKLPQSEGDLQGCDVREGAICVIQVILLKIVLALAVAIESFPDWQGSSVESTNVAPDVVAI